MAQYIDEHLLEDVSLATLAAVVKLSPYHFVRAFKQSFGRDPREDLPPPIFKHGILKLEEGGLRVTLISWTFHRSFQF